MVHVALQRQRMICIPKKRTPFPHTSIIHKAALIINIVSEKLRNKANVDGLLFQGRGGRMPYSHNLQKIALTG
jgi:hypothetical protein